MGEIDIRKSGRTGRITLTRPDALNALTYDMILGIESAVDAWADDPDVAMVVIDAEGERAFCSGGDIAKLYQTGQDRDFAWGQQFWRDEYRLNAKLAGYAKPIAAFCQGFTMGGGVGISLHSSHRVAGRTTQIAMPECGIGLVPDVGGSLLLARAPQRTGIFLGLTGTRMGAADAIWAGFADYFVLEETWPDLIRRLEETGDPSLIAEAGEDPGETQLPKMSDDAERLLSTGTLADIAAKLAEDDSGLAIEMRKRMARNSPLSMAVIVEIMDRIAADPAADVPMALDLEYRFVARSMEHGDFLEGIRAQIIDKDRDPKWRHPWPGEVPREDIDRMLEPI